MKRLITSALALVLAVSLAACSGAAGFAQDADFSSAIESNVNFSFVRKAIATILLLVN